MGAFLTQPRLCQPSPTSLSLSVTEETGERGVCFYLGHERGPGGVVDPAVPAGPDGDSAPVAPKAAEGVGAADTRCVPVHLIPPAAAAEIGPMATPLRHCVIKLLLQAPATALAQLSNPGAEAAVLRDEPKEDNTHIDRGEGSGKQTQDKEGLLLELVKFSNML